MTTPNIAYRIPLVGSGLQATGHADRPACAMAAAWASEAPLLGELRGKSADEANALLEAWAAQADIPLDRLELWVDTIRGAKIPPGSWPATVNGLALSAYQHTAISRLGTAGGVLALDCGLGKTIAALAAAKAYGGRLVIICPLNAVPTWRRAAPAGTLIESMDSAHNLLGLPNTGGVVIFDEAHLLGETTARRTKACHQLRLKFDQGLCLTGTLLHAGVQKTLSIIDLAVPGGALFSSRWKAGEYFHCLVKKQIPGRMVTVLEKPTGQHRASFLEYLSRHVVALTVDSTEVRAAFQLPEQHLYDAELEEPWLPLEQAAANLVLAKVDAGEPGIMSASECAHALCQAGAQSKVDWVMQHLEDEPVVIFANYTATLDAMQQALQDAGKTFVRVDGSVTGAARGECQRKFQAGEAQVFLGQMTAAGVAMDLYRATYSIALDHSWRAADYAQALARTHRRGQTQETHHFDLVANVLQDRLVRRLRAGADFNASLPEYQELKRGTQA